MKVIREVETHGNEAGHNKTGEAKLNTLNIGQETVKVNHTQGHRLRHTGLMVGPGEKQT